MREIAWETEDKMKTDEDVFKSVVPLTSDQVNKNKAFRFTVSMDDKENKMRVYDESYYILNPSDNSIYLFYIVYPELAYSAKARKEVRGILDSIVFK